MITPQLLGSLSEEQELESNLLASPKALTGNMVSNQAPITEGLP